MDNNVYHKEALVRYQVFFPNDLGWYCDSEIVTSHDIYVYVLGSFCIFWESSESRDI